MHVIDIHTLASVNLDEENENNTESSVTKASCIEEVENESEVVSHCWYYQ